jgi:hypothetical protein
MYNKVDNVTEEQLEIIKNLYLNEKFSAKNIGKQFNFGENTVLKILKKLGITRAQGTNRKYTCNSNFFEKIDTEEKAYWLGALYADGCVRNNKNSYSVTLISKDIEWLDKFKEHIEYTGLIYREYHKKFNKECFKLNISDNKLAQDLINCGCTERKSLTIEFPGENILPKNLINHFIRGYFDGDGTVGVYNNSNKIKTIKTIRSGMCCGSLKFMQKLIKYLNLKNIKIYERHRKTQNGDPSILYQL